MLLMKYRAHINLEFCNKSNVIKYLFKYINKGLDRVTASIKNVQTQKHGGQEVDEIKQFYDCRYLAPCESTWRLFAFDIHHKWPSVQRLIFHLPGKQNLLFTDHDKIPQIVEKNKYKDTMFTAWMRANLKFPHGNQFLYSEFSNHFVYLRDSQEWVPRQRGFSIGRLTFIHVGSGEILYLRLLLNVQRGCKSFKSIHTIDGVVYDSFKAACNALGFGFPFSNSMIMNEMNYDVDQLREEHDVNLDKLTDEQKLIYESIIDTVANKRPRFFFVYGFGGTGKTFLWRLLSFRLQSEQRIVLNVASSGIASLLLPNGRTAHSLFCIPIELNEEFVVLRKIVSERNSSVMLL
ncbi:hypothetical protein AAHE18_12G095500 [Arachis hypogaea]